MAGGWSRGWGWMMVQDQIDRCFIGEFDGWWLV